MKQSDPFWKPTLILTVCLALLISFTSFAQSYSPATATHGIRVSGSASVSAVPDQATLNFTIEQRGNKLGALKTQVDQLTTGLIGDLLERDIPRTHIQSFQLNVYPQYEADDDGKREQNGFVVLRTIDVKLTSLDGYDQIIDLALAQGVTRVGQIQFQVSDQQALYQQALQRAFNDAKRKASLIAETAAVSIGKVMHIDEQSASRPVMYEMAAMSSRAKSPSLPGEQQIEAQVNVLFSIAQKND